MADEILNEPVNEPAKEETVQAEPAPVYPEVFVRENCLIYFLKADDEEGQRKLRGTGRVLSEAVAEEAIMILRKE